MYPMLQHSHSGLRWIVLILLVAAVINAGMKWSSGKSFTNGDKKLNLFTMIVTHIQIIIGLILFFISPKVNLGGEGKRDIVTSFLMGQHMPIMILAAILITIGYSRAKRSSDDAKKFKSSFIFYLLGLLLILWAIPWPGRGYGGGWY